MNYRQINNLLRNDEEIDDMIAFINSERQNYPDNVVDEVKYYEKSLLFDLDDDDYLQYENLYYVRKREIPALLNVLYSELEHSLGRGIESFYNFVRKHYLNISREDIRLFLGMKQTYNVSRPKKVDRKYSLKIYKEPRVAYSMDLIDMNYFRNGKFKYILVIVDNFCKYVFLKALTNNQSLTITNAFIQKVVNPGLAPQVVHTDNGVEFQGDFKDYLKENNITQIFNPKYTPVKNVEAMNQNVRRLLRELFIRNKNNVWHNRLNLIETSLNNYYSRENGQYTPSELFNQEEYTGNEAIQEIRQRTRERKRSHMNDTPRYRINDAVKINLIVVNKQITNKNKIKELKNVPVIWSPESYYIYKIHRPRINQGNFTYTIRNEDNELLVNENNEYIKLKESDLQYADNEIEQIGDDITYNQAMRINKLNDNIIDIKFK